MPIDNRFVYSYPHIVNAAALWKLLHLPGKKWTGLADTPRWKYFMIKGLVKWTHF